MASCHTEEIVKNMAISTMIKAIKQVHSKSVVLVKIGSFYHAYGKDSYILSYMFGYKLKKFEKDYTTCGFPLDSISKVMAKLEEKKINYVILDRRNNYEEDEKSDNGNLNTYDKIYENARIYVNLKRRIDQIYEDLMEDIESDSIKGKIIEIEEIINERR